MGFDYFYNREAERFLFYRIPHVFFEESKFKALSSDAKILYALFFHRITLSLKKGWIDEHGRVYIIFTLEEIQEKFGCSNKTAVKIMAELDGNTGGIALIEKKRQGLGKPNIIYVKDFMSDIDSECKNYTSEVKNLHTRDVETTHQEVNNLHGTNNNLRNTDKSKNNLTLYTPDRRSYFESDFGRKQLLDQIINVELVNGYALENGILDDPFYKAQIEQMEKDIRFNSMMRKIMDGAEVTDEEAKAKYESNPSEFSTPESIGAMHILVDSEDKAKEIREKIVNEGMKFEDAAKEFSSCPSKDAGGDLGSFGKGMMVPEFEEAAFALDLDTVSEPVKTQFGYHLINVYDKKEASVQPFEEVAETIKSGLLQEKQMEKYNAFIKELREKNNL